MREADELSKLIQLHMRRAGLNGNITWTGDGNADLISVVLDLSNKTLLSQALWNGIKELWAMPEINQLQEKAEPLYAKIASIILKAQALLALRLDARNTKAQSIPLPGPALKPPGAA